MSEWQPIETAPKDGTPILVAENSRDYPFIAYWGYVGRFTSSEKMWIGHDFGAMPEGSVNHWMPLPEPPEKKG